MEHANIVLVKDATLILHLGGAVNISSSYIGNNNKSTRSWMDPSRIQLYGQSEHAWKITGFSTLKAETLRTIKCN